MATLPEAGRKAPGRKGVPHQVVLPHRSAASRHEQIGAHCRIDGSSNGVDSIRGYDEIDRLTAPGRNSGGNRRVV
jgi:hypothetical protein